MLRPASELTDADPEHNERERGEDRADARALDVVSSPHQATEHHGRDQQDGYAVGRDYAELRSG